MMFADKIVAATGTPSSSVSITSNNWTGLMAAFKASVTPPNMGSTLLTMGVG